MQFAKVKNRDHFLAFLKRKVFFFLSFFVVLLRKYLNQNNDGVISGTDSFFSMMGFNFIQNT